MESEIQQFIDDCIKTSPLAIQSLTIKFDKTKIKDEKEFLEDIKEFIANICEDDTINGIQHIVRGPFYAIIKTPDKYDDPDLPELMDEDEM